MNWIGHCYERRPAFRIALLLTISLGSAMAADPPAAKSALDELFPDTVVAQGHGFEVKRTELEEAYTEFAAQEASQGRIVAPARRSEAEAEVLDRIIITRILVKRATEPDRQSAREKTDKTLEEARNQAASEASFNRRLQAMGRTAEQTRTRLYEQNVCEAVILREVFSKIRVSDEEIRKYHQEHPEQFRQPEMIRASHILLATRDRLTQRELSDEEKQTKRKLAEQLLERARKGEDFARLAREHSDDAVSRDNGGEYTFARGRMVPALEFAAFALRPEQISDLVITPVGFHILKLHQRIPAREVPLSEVTDAVREHLQRQNGRPKLPPYIERLKKEAGVTVTR